MRFGAPLLAFTYGASKLFFQIWGSPRFSSFGKLRVGRQSAQFPHHFERHQIPSKGALARGALRSSHIPGFGGRSVNAWAKRDRALSQMRAMKCLADEKITAIFIVFHPLRALHLHPVAFARFVGRVFSLGHDALKPEWAACSE